MSKGYGDNLLVEDMTFALPPGGIVGVIGPNGAGKTTLFRMITGQEQPDSGHDSHWRNCVARIRRSEPHARSGQIDLGGDLRRRRSVELGKREVNSRAYVARFNFSGSDQQKKVGMLSGGERNRVHLAKMLKEGANVLLLDEPTNDLDVNTLRALEEALENFAGCAVVISHDRWFLDRIATHMLAFEGDSKVVWFEGNYSEYEADRKERLGAAAETPHRIKYRQMHIWTAGVSPACLRKVTGKTPAVPGKRPLGGTVLSFAEGGTAKGPVFRSRAQPSFHRVVLDISNSIFEVLCISNIAIEVSFIPRELSATFKHPIRLVSRVRFVRVHYSLQVPTNVRCE